MAELHVWMNGEFVGAWYTTRTGTPAFQYDEKWTQSERGRALSLSLPIAAGSHEIRGEVVTNYFDNLLPDSIDIKRRLSTRFETKSTSAFDLLAAIGRDCVGAVQLMPPGSSPSGWDQIQCAPLTEQEVEKHLRIITGGSPLGMGADDDHQDEFRISIAGAQEKAALLKIGTEWHRPIGATPTTHILKLPLGVIGNLQVDMSNSIENEWLCAQIMGELGFAVASTDMATFGDQKVLVVKRFDRRWIGINTGTPEDPGFQPPPGSWIARLPQEDFCQATGNPPTKKYENEGGPTMKTCLELLASSENADQDRLNFVLAQLAFWLLAATDGHAKNFSIYHRRGGGFGLTPLYDILSAWPVIGEGRNKLSIHRARLAMAVRSKNAHSLITEIQPRHWRVLADTCGVAGAWERMKELTAAVDTALQRVCERLPTGFPDSTWSPISNGMKKQAKNFLDGMESVEHK